MLYGNNRVVHQVLWSLQRRRDESNLHGNEDADKFQDRKLISQSSNENCRFPWFWKQFHLWVFWKHNQHEKWDLETQCSKDEIGLFDPQAIQHYYSQHI